MAVKKKLDYKFVSDFWKKKKKTAIIVGRAINSLYVFFFFFCESCCGGQTKSHIRKPKIMRSSVVKHACFVCILYDERPYRSVFHNIVSEFMQNDSNTVRGRTTVSGHNPSTAPFAFRPLQFARERRLLYCVSFCVCIIRAKPSAAAVPLHIL